MCLSLIHTHCPGRKPSHSMKDAKDIESSFIHSRFSVLKMQKEENNRNACSVVYSPVYSFSGKSCSYSPDGQHVLFTNGKEVHILSTETQMMEFNLYCSDRVDYAEWSPNSLLVLCFVKRNNTIEVPRDESGEP